jgi:hypothetical protein
MIGEVHNSRRCWSEGSKERFGKHYIMASNYKGEREDPNGLNFAFEHFSCSITMRSFGHEREMAERIS